MGPPVEPMSRDIHYHNVISYSCQGNIDQDGPDETPQNPLALSVGRRFKVALWLRAVSNAAGPSALNGSPPCHGAIEGLAGRNRGGDEDRGGHVIGCNPADLPFSLSFFPLDAALLFFLLLIFLGSDMPSIAGSPLFCLMALFAPSSMSSWPPWGIISSTQARIAPVILGA